MIRNWRVSKSKRNRIGMMFFEAALIVMGVFLGFLTNEWRTTQSHKKEADAALDFIRQELKDNHAQVQKLLPYHRRLKDSLDVLVKRVAGQENPKVSALEFRQAMLQGFSVPILHTNAWELSNRTGAINQMDFSLVTGLSRIYDQQDFYFDKLDQINENWYIAGNINPENFAATALAVGILVNDIVIQEERLVKRYPEVISRLDAFDNE